MRRFWCAIAILLPAAAALGERASLQEAQSVESIMKVTAVESACYTKGAATLGVTISAYLGDSSSCSSFDPTYGTLYADFYTFNATAGQRLHISHSASFSALSTVQDYTLGTVLASSGDSCGLSRSCSFDYVAPVTAKYILGIGAYGSGNYTLAVSASTPPPTASCTANSSTLCLNSSRFAVTVAWRTTDGHSGQGQATSLTGDTGYFWFFSANNVELVVKVVDGRAVNSCFWVFYGALSDVEYTITVRDTATGRSKAYSGQQGRMASVADTSAFN